MKCAACLVAAFVATPCLWDSDTLDTELRGLPDAFDLAIGRWHRHGDAYYRQRVERLGRERELALADYDDLAVAFEHLGERDRAIEVMAAKAVALAKTPDSDQQYRYHANLGTFHAHAGRYEEALHELRAAIAINPDAHFGRETFQIQLIEYAALAQTDPELWARRSFLRNAGYGTQHGYLTMSWFGQRPLTADSYELDWQGDTDLDWHAAYRAIGGMLRFGGREGAELYRSLGELFLDEQHLNLAWWSFQHAIERGHPASDVLRAGLREIERHWSEARSYKDTHHSTPTLSDYRAVRAAADRWLAAFQRLEGEAIARGEDVRSEDALRDLLAAADAEVPRPDVPWSFTWKQWGIAAGVLVLVAWMFDRRRRPRRHLPGGG